MFFALISIDMNALTGKNIWREAVPIGRPAKDDISVDPVRDGILVENDRMIYW
jgi:hypothetical protein